MGATRALRKAPVPGRHAVGTPVPALCLLTLSHLVQLWVLIVPNLVPPPQLLTPSPPVICCWGGPLSHWEGYILGSPDLGWGSRLVTCSPSGGETSLPNVLGKAPSG